VPALAAAGVSVRRALAVLAALAAWAPATAHAQAYEIPPDNPFVGTPGARPEIYAYGMRNPYRWSFDRLTGDMYVGDVGGINEEITFIARARQPGANLGWNCFSGTATQSPCTPTNYVPPAAQYPSSSDVVIGGYAIRDPALPAFAGRYLYGRFSTGLHLLGPRASGADQPVSLVSIPEVSGLGEDGLGHLHATSLSGPVYRISQNGSALAASKIGDFAQPVAVAGVPGDSARLFVAEKAGRVRNRDGSVFLDLTGLVRDTGYEEGLLSVAASPDYAVSGRVFVFYNDNAGNLQVDQFTRVAAGPDRSALNTRTPVITISHAQADNHNGGQLLFGPENHLYLSTGDGGTQGDPEGDAQNLGSLLGKILRVDVNVGAAPPPPPAPATPIRDAAAPKLRVRVKRRQRLLRLRGAVARVRCNEACAVRAAGVLRIGKRRFRLRSATRRAQVAQTTRRVRLKVRLRPRSRRVLRRAMRRGRRPLVRVGLRATDTAGNSSRIVYRKVRARR
jgi:glucose/arabinose dehydrogenase